MKKEINVLLLFAMLFTIISCNPLEKAPNLYIRTTTSIENGKSKVDSVSIVNSDYFEVGLLSFSEVSKGFMASKYVVVPTSLEDFKMVYFVISNEDGSDLYFKSSTEFLNYMAERKYEMVDQTKSKKIDNDIDYTFKKK